MIHAIIGELILVGAQHAVIRTSGGMEFSLVVSGQTASRLSQLHGDARRQVRLITHLQHKEDGMTLFGFIDEEERLLFEQLITVNGIGPKQAMKILGSVQVRAFVRALDQNDIAFLSKIPGIGPKTSQKIMLALRDTIVLDQQNTDNPSMGGVQLDKRYGDLVAALVDMGYDKRQVMTTITKLLEDHHADLATRNQREAEEFLFRQAIVSLG